MEIHKHAERSKALSPPGAVWLTFTLNPQCQSFCQHNQTSKTKVQEWKDGRIYICLQRREETGERVRQVREQPGRLGTEKHFWTFKLCLVASVCPTFNQSVFKKNKLPLRLKSTHRPCSRPSMFLCSAVSSHCLKTDFFTKTFLIKACIHFL